MQPILRYFDSGLYWLVVILTAALAIARAAGGAPGSDIAGREDAPRE